MKVPAIAAALAVAITTLSVSTNALDRKFDALNYDTRGYDSDGCKWAGNIEEEFAAFAKVTDKVRIYSTSCNEKVLNAASKAGLKVWIGLWSDVPAGTIKDAFDSEFNNLKNLVNGGKIRNDNVLGIQVASEALYRFYIQGKVNETQTSGYDLLVKHVTDVRGFLRGKGMLFPVTITDVMDAYNLFPQIYSAVDVVSVNQFSMWENVTAENGVSRLFDHWKVVQKQARAAGKPIVLSETGWSTADDKGLVAEASPAAQATYTKDFLAFAEKQSINYYYFSSIDLNIHADLIEKSFGVFDVNKNLKDGIRNIQVGSKPVATRIFHGDNVLKVDPDNWNALLVGPPTEGPGANMDNEIWFYNPDNQRYYSKSSHQCLDAYGDHNNALAVHVYTCTEGNSNQNWQITSDGHLATLNGAGQCMDVDPNQDNKVVMWWCYDGPNQKFSKRDFKDEQMQITVNGGGYLNEWYSGVSWNPSMSSQYSDNTMWYYDPIAQTIKSKSGNTCLDAYLDGNSYTVHTYSCDPTNSNQHWLYNDVTGQWFHQGHLGLCLAGSGNAGAVGGITLQYCDKNQSNQKWAFKFGKAIA
ncbi:glycoside hydrolase [Thraustotheca clavata]|uniref:glucan endo-1,3-beta-D-glucosidase n=1 Tax=Thraustotheca clavata TaxID=74557 RepID=A0A1V9ZF68_9STRA|nr:glycoside hydrolase [Thraustotheca clavata]